MTVKLNCNPVDVASFIPGSAKSQPDEGQLAGKSVRKLELKQEIAQHKSSARKHLALALIKFAAVAAMCALTVFGSMCMLPWNLPLGLSVLLIGSSICAAVLNSAINSFADFTAIRERAMIKGWMLSN